MTVQKKGSMSWINVFPMEKHPTSAAVKGDEDAVLLVDVAGGRGHSCTPSESDI